jgi:hypothetical protein
MQKFYTFTTIERDSESEWSDSRPSEMLLWNFLRKVFAVL